MKYFVYKGQYGEEIDIFSECSEMNHAQRAERLNVLDYIVSAGFIQIDFKTGAVKCDGFATSLEQRLGREIVSRGKTDEDLFLRLNSIRLGR